MKKKYLVSLILSIAIFSLLLDKFKYRLNSKVYLDNQSTTPVDSRVVRLMSSVQKQYVGNPSSIVHSEGLASRELVESSRAVIADAINANPEDIIFTSGATEASNIAIKGFARHNKSKSKNHIITTSIEHKASLMSCEDLENEGIEVTFLNPGKSGLIDLKQLEDAITDQTMLITIIWLHNEIGVIQDIENISKIAKKHNVMLHVDAAQALGKVDIDVKKLGIDLMSMSGHKIYGPKGIGALYVSSREDLTLSPIMSGGGQERGLRSGTLPTFLIAGFAEALRLNKQEKQADLERIDMLTRELEKELMSLGGVHLNGDRHSRYVGNLNLSFDCVDSKTLLENLKRTIISSTSACTSSKELSSQRDLTANLGPVENDLSEFKNIGVFSDANSTSQSSFCNKEMKAALNRSYVMRAMGFKPERILSTIRIGVGKFNNSNDIKVAAKEIKAEVKRIRSMNKSCKIQG